MSRKKSKKNIKEQNNERPLRINEIIGIIILAFGVLMALAFYFQGNDSFSIGKFGDVLRTLFFGLFGITAYAIPPVVIVFAVISFFEKSARIIKQQLIGICCMFVIVSALLNVAYYNPNPLENLSQLGYIQYFWKTGVAMKGGGIFGGILSIIFLITVDVLGTIIILSAMAIIDVIIITRISIVKTTKTFVKGTKILKDNLVDIMRTQKDDNDEYEITDDTNIIDINSAKKKFNFKTDENERETSDEQRLKNITYEDPDDFGSGILGSKKRSKQADIVSIKNMDEDINYTFPDINLLNRNDETEKNIKIEKSVAFDTAKKLEITLKSFGVEAKVININRGPTVTRFELQPSPGVKVSSIVNLADDISLNLASSGVRIEAPIPGKAAVGIEVPNRIITSVPLREVIETQNFEKCQSKLAFAVGKNIAGDSIVADISNMPHLLIAGSTGSGKSVCINSMIISLLYKSSPRDVQLLMIDTKVVELASYNGIPHLLVPVVTDPKKASSALNWAVREMTNRYKLFAEKGVRDIEGYNEIMKKSAEEEEEVLPKIVIIIDELADLMIVAPSDVEDAICRLAQMARAAGMHLVIATQRPSVNVITGIIKANIPSRISFSVSSHIDSRTILDTAGAEKLLGKGDMLYHPVGEPKPIRIQGSYVTKSEIEKIVEFVKEQTENEEYNESIIEEINNDIKLSEAEDDEEYDELFDRALEIVVDAGQASASLLQRKFKIGFSRAGRIIDQMENRNFVGPSEGSKPRQVLISKIQLQEMQMRGYKDSKDE